MESGSHRQTTCPVALMRESHLIISLKGERPMMHPNSSGPNAQSRKGLCSRQESQWEAPDCPAPTDIRKQLGMCLMRRMG